MTVLLSSSGSMNRPYCSHTGSTASLITVMAHEVTHMLSVFGTPAKSTKFFRYVKYGFIYYNQGRPKVAKATLATLAM
ncbi:hypothetical protein BpHYR1_012305 [Brachionus plicatilis]|uniref:Uncharacterized protein n=1 Tax=Brachionus plicatilis TaxID=10195 RepID=A0A3M7R7M6_BRAPC|nr:hypothetical protein BpHYR1_012305 [Brachionus plicatilis]